MRITVAPRVCLLMGLAAAAAAHAEEPEPEPEPAAVAEPGAEAWWSPESGRLLATSGVSQIEGAGGGGLVPWALIAGYGTQDAVGANVHYTVLRAGDFTLHGAGAAVGLMDRVELSFDRQFLDTGSAGARLGLGSGFTFDQSIAGAKVRLFGDAVYDQDLWWPQVSAGAQWKLANRGALLKELGARSADGVDCYVAATKLLMSESLLLDATVRATRANQFGLLGFGGDRDAGYGAQFEGSAALLLSRRLAVGAEFRSKPDNLGFAREDDAWDAFGAWFIDKNLSVTLAYVQLGRVARQGDQGGVYLSLQAGFLTVRFRRHARALLLAAATSGAAASAATSGAAASPCAAATLFEDLGGADGLTRIVAASSTLWLEDGRIRQSFADANVERLKSRIVEQLCLLSGGGCVYRGHDMATAHKGLHLDTRQFNAVAEDMEIAMERLGVPFWTQDRLMALLAPMRRDVVTR